MSTAKPVRTLITVIMDVLVVVAVVLVTGLVVKFFGVVADTEFGVLVVKVTEAMRLPLGVEDIATPYGGAFDIRMAGTVLLLLVAEWLLSIVRRQA